MKNLFRKITVIICSMVILLAGIVFAGVKVGDDAPNFSLKDSKNDSSVSLDSLKGKKIIYLSFFATWCANCKEEMKTLIELHSTYKDEGLEMIAVNVKEDSKKVNKFISKYKIPFTVLLDEKADVAKSYNLVGFPSNIIIDAEGKIIFIDSRPPSNFQELFNKIKPTIKSVGKSIEKPVEKPAEKPETDNLKKK